LELNCLSFPYAFKSPVSPRDASLSLTSFSLKLMSIRFTSIDVKMNSERVQVPENADAAVLSFSRSFGKQPEWVLPEVLNDDEAIINGFWCDMIKDLVVKQPATFTRQDWIEICEKLVEIIYAVAVDHCHMQEEPTVAACRELQSLVLADVPPDPPRPAPEGPIPLDVGLPLPQVTYPDDGGDTGEAAQAAVQEIDERAAQAAFDMLSRDEEIQVLQRRVTHRRSLAKSRLAEMRRGLEFRQRVISLHGNQVNQSS
jgi:hypothetical protein